MGNVLKILLDGQHVQMHPNFISGYNLQVIPEFPLPALLIMIPLLAVVMVTRLRPKLS